MKDPIYVPKGRAREYSPWAVNVYTKCPHGCDYCYNGRFGDFYCASPEPRDGICEAVRDQLSRMRPDGQVLLSFMGDPYGPAEDQNLATRDILAALYEHRVPAAVLTKAGTRCLRDLPIFLKFGQHIQVGASLTYFDRNRSLFHEQGAAEPMERIAALYALHAEGVPTFASIEPVIDPGESLRLIEASIEYVDVYRIGKLTGRKPSPLIDWTYFVDTIVHLLRSEHKPFYIKDSLASDAKPGLLTDEERDPDAHLARWE